MSNASILFPNLGISFANVGRYLQIGSFQIAFYGIAIAIGMYLGISLIQHLAKRSGQNEDQYLTLCMLTLAAGIVGARLYYVAFSWEYYRDHLTEIVNVREGGLAIYGGIMTGALVVFAYAWKKKEKLLCLADTIVPGLALGQAIGRWGNFFNREAFGRYTDSIFAMALPQDAVYASDVTAQMLEHIRMVDDVAFIQVHPTFLYESVWNLGLLTTLLLVFARKRFDGEIFALYLGGYGTGRFLIESLRTDQLLLPGSTIPVSMIVSLVFVCCAVMLLFASVKRKKD